MNRANFEGFDTREIYTYRLQSPKVPTVESVVIFCSVSTIEWWFVAILQTKKATADMPPNTTIALVQECFLKFCHKF